MITIRYTHLEDFIHELYKKLAISNPGQLEVSYIANKLNLNIHYANVSFWYENNIIIKRSTSQKEWQTFGHEACHYLRHYGNQLVMHRLFRELQEYQANHFAYHFCVPTFMLGEMESLSVYEIMNLFNVEYEFAYKRLEMYERKMIYARAYS